jgi:ParB-like chromosome segregation protein Spo0J
MDLIPCIRLSHLSEAQKRAYVIADNKLALNAGWDDSTLRDELLSLQGQDYDLSLLGFTEDELAEMLASVEETEMPDLESGDRQPIQQMAFILHDDQAETVKEAIACAKDLGPFIDTENENSNGNAIARVCELFLAQYANR